MSKSRQFYAQLLSISKSNLVETSFFELEKLTGLSILVIATNINSLKKIGVIESFFNSQAYDKQDYRLFIGLSSPEFISKLFQRGS